MIEVLLPPAPAAAELPPTPRTKDESSSISPTVIRQSDVTRKHNTREALKAGWGNISRRVIDYLQVGDRLERMLDGSKLKDIGIFAGISTEKTLLMEGEPTQIIGQPQHQALDRLGLALKDALDKRGLVTLTERKVDIKLDGPGTPKQTL
ncbi:MAG: hypothetical protein ABL983_00905 [Nitrospira sp.]